MNDCITNGKYKDGIFRSLFGEKERIIELYNAIEGTHYDMSTPIKIETLEDTMYNVRKNDLAFTIEDKFIILVEHQSTINENIPLRMLIYLARVYEKIVSNDVIYKEKLVKIPIPEMYVLYNGVKEQPKEQILKLSDAFADRKEEIFVEVKVKVININYKEESEILSKSKTLKGYSTLIYLIRKSEKEGKTRDEAMRIAVTECIKQNILKEFLENNSSEVYNMLFREFDIDEAMRVRKEEGRKEGREEIAIKLLKRKMALEEIKEITNLPLEILYEIQRAQR